MHIYVYIYIYIYVLYVYVNYCVHLVMAKPLQVGKVSFARLQVWLENRHQIPPQERDGPIKAAEWKREWCPGPVLFGGDVSRLWDVPQLWNKWG